MTETPESKSDFDAAKAIVGELKGFEREQQERILRWVTESLKLPLQRAPVPAGTPRNQWPSYVSDRLETLVRGILCIEWDSVGVGKPKRAAHSSI
jgi:hypothetical protein